MRQSERVKFRDELRNVLQSFGNRRDRKSTSWPSDMATTLIARS